MSLLRQRYPVPDDKIFLVRPHMPQKVYVGVGFIEDPNNPQLCTFFMLDSRGKSLTVRSFSGVPFSLLDSYFRRNTPKQHLQAKGSYTYLENRILFGNYVMQKHHLLKPVTVYGKDYWFQRVDSFQTTYTGLRKGNPFRGLYPWKDSDSLYAKSRKIRKVKEPVNIGSLHNPLRRQLVINTLASAQIHRADHALCICGTDDTVILPVVSKEIKNKDFIKRNLSETSVQLLQDQGYTITPLR